MGLETDSRRGRNRHLGFINVFVDGRADPCLGLLFTPCVRFVFVGVPAVVAAGVGFVASRFVPEEATGPA